MPKSAPQPPHGYDLITWGQILPLLGDVSEALALRLVAREVDPLPVTRWLSGKMIARRDEVLAWKARQTSSASGDGVMVPARALTSADVDAMSDDAIDALAARLAVRRAARKIGAA